MDYHIQVTLCYSLFFLDEILIFLLDFVNYLVGKLWKIFS